jgi:hypothetical protein
MRTLKLSSRVGRATGMAAPLQPGLAQWATNGAQACQRIKSYPILRCEIEHFLEQHSRYRSHLDVVHVAVSFSTEFTIDPVATPGKESSLGEGEAGFLT